MNERIRVRLRPGTNRFYATGGSSAGAATSLGFIFNANYNVFILGDGFYSGIDITRPHITIRAENQWSAKTGPLGISADNVTVDGIETTYDATSVITVFNSGARILNCRIHDFNRTVYGNGIWVQKSALNPANPVILQGNTITDWGGPTDDANIGSGILVGAAPPEAIDIDAITVQIINNHVMNGPTVGHGAGIGIFHPCLVVGNFVDNLFGAGISSKARNSIIQSNEVAHITSDGALYNRFQGNNLWESNLVHDCTVGIDHFMGVNDTFRGNVIYNVTEFGRIKNQGITTGLRIDNNTFYNSTGIGWSWDLSDPSGFLMNDILWQRNIWHTTVGAAIQSAITSSWDETDNIFWNTTAPSPLGIGSQVVNPLLTNPPIDFTATAPAAAGKGAPWPLPGF